MRSGGVYAYDFAIDFRAIDGVDGAFHYGIVREFYERFWLTRFGISDDLKPLNGSMSRKQRSNVLLRSVLAQVSDENVVHGFRAVLSGKRHQDTDGSEGRKTACRTALGERCPA